MSSGRIYGADRRTVRINVPLNRDQSSRSERGDVDCYSFIAVDFHHILPAGFSRRTYSRYSPHTHGIT
jgi:hypothetical protein